MDNVGHTCIYFANAFVLLFDCLRSNKRKTIWTSFALTLRLRGPLVKWIIYRQYGGINA